MHLQPRFTLDGDDMTASVDDGWVLTPPPYSRYFTPTPQIAQQKGPAKRETRSVLKKRRTFTDSPRLRPPKEQPRPRPSTYVEPSQPQRMQIPFPQSASASKHSILLPSLRTDSLWLNRPTQPLRIRKSSQSRQSPPPWWNGSGTSYVVSNSPILPIGGKVPSRPTTLRPAKSSSSLVGKAATATSANAAGSTSTLIAPPIHGGLETLIASVESDFKQIRRPSRPVSVATSLSAYSQASASYSFIPEAQEFEGDSGTGKKDEETSDTYSIRSAETVQLPTSQRPSTDQATTSYDVDPRLSTSTSTHASVATSSTLSTLVDPSTPHKDRKHLEGTRLSLQPCPSLASANRILSVSDLPPNHDAPSPIDENTYRRYEHEGKIDSPFNGDICADYDYFHAIDVLIYGVRPLPDVPVDLARHPSRPRPRPRRDNSISRRSSDRRHSQVLERSAHTTPSVPFNRTTRKNSSKMDPKGTVKMEARQEHQDERRSIFFQVTHLFGKPSSS